MMENSLPFLATLAAYLIGSLSFAVVISRLMGLNDPRTYGSKNPGATNVLRSGNKIAAVLTLLLDAIKGWLPVYLVKVHGADWGLGESTLAWVFLAAFLGHLFPVFFRFKGGKGVATAAGVLIALEPTLALAILASWLIVVYFSRMVSLASIVAALFAPVYYLFGDGVAWSAPGAQVLAVAVMGLLLIWRHAENIGRIVAGSESRLGAKKP
jgi:glycerol-3-phosphate acyltransferase PlsY